MSNMVINTNILALNSHRNAKNVGALQAKASARLSSGLKINSAADDAAGLAISEKMRAQIRGLDMASKNSQDGISLIQTAEGGMQEIDNMLQRIREITVQASNDTNEHNELGTGDRQKMQDEVDQLISEIDSMAERIEFNKKKVINGSYEDANKTYTKASENFDRASANRGTATTTGTAKALKDAKDKYMGTGTTDATNGTKGKYDDLKTMMDTLNGTGATSIVGLITATTASAGIAQGSGGSEIVAFDAAKALVTQTTTLTTTAAQIINGGVDVLMTEINAATLTFTTATGTTAADPDDIIAAKAVNDFVTAFKGMNKDDQLEFLKSGSSAINTLIDNAIANAGTGTVATADLTAVKAEFKELSDTVIAADAMFGKKDDIIDNAYSQYAAATTATNGTTITALTTKATFDNKFKEVMDANKVAKSEYDDAQLADTRLADKIDKYKSQMIAAQTKINANNGKTAGLYFQVGANADQGIQVSIGSVKSDVLGIGNGNGNEGVATGDKIINFLRDSGKQITNLLDDLDEALSYVTTERSLLGATQNRLEYTMKSLDISSENLAAAESRIRDTDMAKEMMNLTKANVLQQAANSMLAQANQAPQAVLQLLG